MYFSSEPGDEEGGRLNFLKFETDKIDTCIEFMKRLKKEYMQRNGSGTQNDLCVMATGGGAYKYYDRIKEALGVEVMREDEMECLIIGKALLVCSMEEEFRANCEMIQVWISLYQRYRARSSATATRIQWLSYRPHHAHTLTSSSISALACP